LSYTTSTAPGTSARTFTRISWAVAASSGVNLAMNVASWRSGAAGMRATVYVRRIATSPLYGSALWPASTDDDEPCRFVRDRITGIVRALSETSVARAARSRARRAP
jgi:hypothetical protein